MARQHRLRLHYPEVVERVTVPPVLPVPPGLLPPGLPPTPPFAVIALALIARAAVGAETCKVMLPAIPPACALAVPEMPGPPAPPELLTVPVVIAPSTLVIFTLPPAPPALSFAPALPRVLIAPTLIDPAPAATTNRPRRPRYLPSRFVVMLPPPIMLPVTSWRAAGIVGCQRDKSAIGGNACCKVDIISGPPRQTNSRGRDIHWAAPKLNVVRGLQRYIGTCAVDQDDIDSIASGIRVSELINIGQRGKSAGAGLDVDIRRVEQPHMPAVPLQQADRHPADIEKVVTRRFYKSAIPHCAPPRAATKP